MSCGGEGFANPFIAAERGSIDEVILPRTTRRRICRAFNMLRNKTAAKVIDEVVGLLDAGKLDGDQARQQMLKPLGDVQGVEVVGLAINTKSRAFESQNGYVSFSSPKFSEQYHQFLILEGRRIVDVGDFAPDNFLASNVVAIQHVSFTKLGWELVRKICKTGPSN